MGRPRKGEELRTILTTRVDSLLAKEIKEIAEALYGNITAVTEDLIKIGLEEFKKRKPEIMKIVEKRQEEKLKSFHDETHKAKRQKGAA